MRQSPSPHLSARDSDRPVILSFRRSHPAPTSPPGHTRMAASRPPLHRLEVALVGVTALHLCFLPWALGAMHGWSQLTSLGFSLVGFILASLPRTAARDFPPGALVVDYPANTLLRIPIFWAGLGLLGYIAVQGFNSAWRFVSDAESWWLVSVAHVAWLPSGVDAPFDRSNPWRALVVGASLWLLVCSLWIGFLRRRSYRALFTVLVANAALLALLGVVQKLAGAKRIFWSYLPSNDAFIASFIYPNHAGPYFNLLVALGVGLAWWQYQRVQRGLGKIAAARACTFLAVFIGVAVVFSYSRMSIVLLLVFTALIGGVLAARRIRRKGPALDHPEFLPLALILAGVLGVGLVSLRSDKILERFAAISANPAALTQDRALARHAATDMLRDRWLLGWGAGCFRHGFPLYAQNYPDLYLSPGGGRKYWEHAHDDLLEFPVELGVVGLLPLLAILGYGVRQLARGRFWRNRVSVCAVLGCALVLLHAGVDFVFQNPAVLLTWSVLFIGAARWAELDPPG